MTLEKQASVSPVGLQSTVSLSSFHSEGSEVVIIHSNLVFTCSLAPKSVLSPLLGTLLGKWRGDLDLSWGAQVWATEDQHIIYIKCIRSV